MLNCADRLVYGSRQGARWLEELPKNSWRARPDTVPRLKGRDVALRRPLEFGSY